jgi:transcription initiation factor TFIIIB Brf1 subunit/transcription initiation factor TFIIB
MWGGEVVCISCGTVISDKIPETRAEWRVFTINELNSRTRGRNANVSCYP